jgi:hypothetical protein
MTATTDKADPLAPSIGVRPRLLPLLARPRETWLAYAAAQPSAKSIFFRYAVPLAAIPAVAKALGLMVFGIQIFGVLVKPAPVMAVAAGFLVYVAALLSALILAGVIDAFSAVFNGEKGFGRAMMLSVFAHAPGWLGGVFLVLPAMGVLPPLGILTIGLTLYGFYLLYLGLQPVMKVKRDNCPVYGGVALVVFLGLWGAVSLSTTAFDRVAMVPAPGATLHTKDGDIDVSKLKAAARSIQAQMNSKDPPPPAASTAELESLLPSDLVPGYSRSQVTSNSASVGRLNGSTAQGTYVKDKATIAVSISDVGSLAGLATAVTLNTNKSTATGYERSAEIDGRLTVEKYDRPSSSGEYDVLVGNRFLVRAKGQAPVEVLKSAVHAIDFARLEAMAKG